MTERFIIEGSAGGEAFRVIDRQTGKATAFMNNEDGYHEEGGQLAAQEIWQRYWEAQNVSMLWPSYPQPYERDGYRWK